MHRARRLLGQLQPQPTSSTISSATKPSFYTPVEAIPPTIHRLHASFRARRTRRVSWRLSQLRALLQALRRPETVALLTRALETDLHRSPFETSVLVVATIIGELRDTIAKLRAWLRPVRSSAPVAMFPASCEVVREPLGVVCVVGAWNAPILLCLLPLIGAIAGGNCVVVKPSERAQASAQAVAHLLSRSLDQDCFAVVQGGVEETQMLLEQQFQHIFYTGGERVGRIVMEKAARFLTPVTLELGGKCPTIIDKDANITVAARRVAWGRCVNSGQLCVAPDYVLCHRDVYDRFVAEVCAAIKKMHGADPKQSKYLGRMIDANHVRRVAALLDEDEAVRGRVVCGGPELIDECDCYVPPTVLVDTTPTARIMREEIFGPVLPILKVASTDQAIAFVNERPNPLALYIFSSNKDVQARVVQHTSSGSVGINEVIMQYLAPSLPFGGVGNSGIGKYRGKHSFKLFTHPKAILDKSDMSMFDLDARYPPYTKGKQALMRAVM